MVENQHIEYKEIWKDEYLKWICGFANANGGKIYIGKDDNGKVVGVTNAQKLLEDIPNKVQSTMGIVVDVNLKKNNKLEFIEILVPSYPYIGITYKGVYYYRSGATLQVLSSNALESFLLNKRGVTWDRQPLPLFTANDVDDNVIEYFKIKSKENNRISEKLLNETKEILLDKLHLTSSDYLTNAASLLFGKDPEKYHLGAYIKIGYFETDSELKYQDEIHGPILEQVDKTIDLVYFKYMKAKISYEGIQRVEKYFVPREALREALLNAVCHKQYQSGIPIQVSVYSDKLYIANMGQLPASWTFDNLMDKHPSKPYNPLIAQVFYLVGFIESWGRGIEKIYEALEKENLPKPKYIINPTDIMIKFTAADSFIEKVTEKVTEKLTKREQDILKFLKNTPEITMPQLAENLGMSRKSIAKYIKGLKDKQIIERVGSDRKGYWKIN